MQKQKTRLTNLILSIFMVLGVFSAFPSLGVNAETFEDYTYTVLEDGTAEITDYTGTDTELEIPAEINGYIVNSIGEDAFLGCSSLTSIIIPEGVTSIGNGAFWDCSSLCSITIPEGVTSIGNSAFMYCSSLTGATIPEGVISIGGSAF
ncbi:MAG: leucine-rich repeat domain-containing protein, partial [Oscillospiraceae bacterium]|nr:leucine-rich repeat domain-containing protein [Oscillospiraceae bacterium]